MSEDLICSSCGKCYIYDKIKKQSANKIRCGSCNVSEFRRKRKIKCVEYKGGSCALCGFYLYVSALDFHHKDPLLKSFKISDGNTRSWEVTKVELDKCIMVCANCHRGLHSGDIETKEA